MNIATPLSIIGLVHRSPAPSAQRALEAVENGGKQLLSGQTGVLPNAPQLLESAAQADGLCNIARKMLRSFGDHELPIDSVESQLYSLGLSEGAKGTVAADYTHHFEMSYGANGGFRGSRSYDAPGETPLARVKAFQKAGALPTDPALVRVDYTRPGHVGPCLNGTIMDQMSSARSLYFTTDLSKVNGLEGKTIGSDEDCKERLEQLFTSLEQASPLQLHSYTTGYGRVGTSYYDKARVAGNDTTNPVEVAAASLQGMRHILGLSGKATQSAPAQAPSATSRMLGSLAAGGAAGALGTALLGGLHPAAGAALAAAAIGGLGAAGHLAHRNDPRDFPLPNAAALDERNQVRARRGLENGLLLGTALSASAAAGAAFGWQGAVAAAICCAGVEALLGAAQS